MADDKGETNVTGTDAAGAEKQHAEQGTDLARRKALQRIGQFGVAYTAPALLAMLAADRAVAQVGSTPA
jgi:hypothetical protein